MQFRSGDNEIGVLLKLLSSASMAQSRQQYLYAFPPNELERGHKVTVAGNNDHCPYLIAQRQPGHVHSDPDIDALFARYPERSRYP